MAKNLIVCCDGTNNQFGICNTNVVRLAQVAVQDPDTQLVYYDPGVGTLPDVGALTSISKKFSEIKALAFGTDIETKVQTAYAHLMEYWEEGDSVFLFGFSRGAYTVRVLAGLLHSLGLLPPGNAHLLPYVMRIYGSLRRQPDKSGTYWDLCDNFRWSFARPVSGHADRRFPVRFVGVWDTVASVGWIWNPTSYPFTHRNQSIQTIRHAVSIDERRWFFRQNLFAVEPTRDTKEYWFAGVHSDVGGGYPEKSGGLWRVTFEWMLKEARAAGLLVDSQRLDAVRTRSTAPEKPWKEPANESLRGLMWTLAEFVPKRVYDPRSQLVKLGIGGFRHRIVQNGAEISKAALQRLREGQVNPTTPYNPPNLNKPFVERVRSLADVPEHFPYVSDSPTTT